MYRVISTFFDRARKQHVRPGESWEPASADQAARLERARCVVVVGESVDEAPVPDVVPAPPPRRRRGKR